MPGAWEMLFPASFVKSAFGKNEVDDPQPYGKSWPRFLYPIICIANNRVLVYLIIGDP